jgi:hypothetical protein
MRLSFVVILILTLLPEAVLAQGHDRFYSYEDEDGVLIITDKPPPGDSELPKAIVNDEGVTVGTVRGKKTEEEIAAERAAAELALQKELQKRADRALLGVYGSVDEILMHRDRRVELFKAQARVTELYLANQRRALDAMKREVVQYRPYSADPDAAAVPEDLVTAIAETESTIERHEQNLLKSRAEEKEIIERFAGDIRRFRELKGID